ncbi:MAG: ion transporter [Hyphomonadaceae bacterium]|nr:ion transporter [Hyphomonadaceae bacterium]
MGNAKANAAPAAGQQRAKVERRGGIRWIAWLTESSVFQVFILLCIVANAAALGIDAHFGENNPWHMYIEEADTVFLGVFTVELILEFLAQGPRRYFRNGWNIFDVIVVGICYVAVNPAISALRTLRVVRVFRLISAVPQMRRVVEALFGAMPGILATFAILIVVFYIGAVMATTLFRGEDGFHDLGQSALTLFQLTQFDGWGDTIARLQPKYPWAWAFIMTFTIIGAFAVLNLFIGVIVEAVQEAPREEIKAEMDEVQEGVHEVHISQEDAEIVQRRILSEIVALRAEIAALRTDSGGPTQ